MFMTPIRDRSMLIEAVRQLTHDLAMSQPTVAEAAALRAKIADLLEAFEERSALSRHGERGGATGPGRWPNDPGDAHPSSLFTAV
jgi:hypothetical protein